MLHLKIKRYKTMFILASTLIYHDWHNNCCFDVANIGMVIEVFFCPLFYDIRYKRYGTENLK